MDGLRRLAMTAAEADDLRRVAVDLDDQPRVGPRLLMEPVDVLGHQGVQPPGALEGHDRGVTLVGLRLPERGRQPVLPRPATHLGVRDVHVECGPPSRPRGPWSTRPRGPRKSGIPESVEMPAPVRTTIRRARPTSAPARCQVGVGIRPATRSRHGPPSWHGSPPSSRGSSAPPRLTGRHDRGRYAACVARGAPTVELLGAADAEDRQRRAAGALLARGCRPGDRVVFCLGSSADLICAVLGAARVGVIPVLLNATLTEAERDGLMADAQPVLAVLAEPELSASVRRTAGGAGAVPVDPADALHLGHHGRPKGVTTGVWDEATAQGRLRRRGCRVAVRPATTSTWSAHRCTTRCRCGSPPARCSRAARWPSSAGSTPPRRSACSADCARPPRSWSRPTCSGYCTVPSWRTTSRSTRCASWPTPAPRARPR